MQEDVVEYFDFLNDVTEFAGVFGLCWSRGVRNILAFGFWLMYMLIILVGG